MSIKSFLINGVEHHYDHNELENIPEINGVLLKGKLTTEELGIKDGKEGPQGEPGAAGADGYSPTVTVTTITGGHRVTITDAEHPTGQSFDVMDGTGGGGSVTVDDALSDFSTNPVQNKVIKTALDAKGTYSKPSGGIPDSDIASAATWNAKGTYSKPSGGIPKSDLASTVQTSLGKADTAYQKPSSGIPASDLAAGVIPTVPTKTSELTNDSGFLTLATLPVYNGGVT